MNLGLLGASKIASRILPAIQSVKGIQIAGVAASTKERADLFAIQAGIRSLGVYEQCLNNSSIDAVYISVLNADHEKIIELALSAGKHVLCEKPMVLTHTAAKGLFDLAKSKGLILLEGFMYRFHPQILKMHELLAAGSIGKLRSIRLNFSFILETHGTARRTREAAGGAITDLGCYCVDFLNSVIRTGEVPEISYIKVSLEKDQPSSVDEDCVALLSYSSGLRAILECGISRPSVNNWELSGEKGAISALRFNPQDSSSSSILVLNEDSEPTYAIVPASEDKLSEFRSEFKNFLEAVEGNSKAFISPEESILNARVLEMLRRYVAGKD